MLRGFYVRTTQIENSVPADTWWKTWHILVLNTNKVLYLWWCARVAVSREKHIWSMDHDDAPQIAIIGGLKRGTIWEDQNCPSLKSMVCDTLDSWLESGLCSSSTCLHWNRPTFYVFEILNTKENKINLGWTLCSFGFAIGIGWGRVLWAFDNWAFIIFK